MIVSGVLAEILGRKRAEIATLSSPGERRRIEEKLQRAPPPRDFLGSLSKGGGFRIIAEMKKASPSRGVLSPEYDPGRIAREYESGGAAALSVLTDAPFFQGSPSHLEAVHGAATLPVLRKDFVLDGSQVEESRGLGADAILLIAAVLEPRLLRRLRERAAALGMESLVEVHEGSELSLAVDAGARAVGVNNRDLSTFQVDLRVSLDLAGKIPAGILRVSESGLSSRSDLERLSQAGYEAFLVGEALMTAEDRTSRIREWVG